MTKNIQKSANFQLLVSFPASTRKEGEYFDRFELSIVKYKNPEIDSYMVQCNVHACQYGTTDDACRLSPSCKGPELKNLTKIIFSTLNNNDAVSTKVWLHKFMLLADVLQCMVKRRNLKFCAHSSFLGY